MRSEVLTVPLLDSSACVNGTDARLGGAVDCCGGKGGAGGSGGAGGISCTGGKSMLRAACTGREGCGGIGGISGAGGACGAGGTRPTTLFLLNVESFRGRGGKSPGYELLGS